MKWCSSDGLDCIVKFICSDIVKCGKEIWKILNPRKLGFDVICEVGIASPRRFVTDKVC